MKKRQNDKNNALSLISCLFLLLNSLVLFADDKPLPSSLHVRGEAQLMVSPDQAELRAGVLSQALKAKKALADNSKAMDKVIKALRALGIPEADITTQGFSVQPQWSPRPRNADSSWRATITGYRVNNTVAVKTTKLALIGELISAATEAGANKIDSVKFSLADPRKYRSQALTQAVNNARADAEVAASAAGSRIIGIQSLTVDRSVASVTQVNKEAMVLSSARAAPAPPISSGDITVRASVSVTYLLGSLSQ